MQKSWMATVVLGACSLTAFAVAQKPVKVELKDPAGKAVGTVEFAKKGKILFSGSPRFNEFVVQTKDDPIKINERLLKQKTIGGFPLSWHYPELGNAAVWCCTELNSKEQIDAAAQAVGQ